MDELAKADHEAQAEHTKRLCALLADAAQEIEDLRLACSLIPMRLDQGATVLGLLARLAVSKRIERPQAALDNMLAAARVQAVLLARAHGATWTAVGEALGEARTNVRTRYINS